jgi:hypothetical protein
VLISTTSVARAAQERCGTWLSQKDMPSLPGSATSSGGGTSMYESDGAGMADAGVGAGVGACGVAGLSASLAIQPTILKTGSLILPKLLLWCG